MEDQKTGGIALDTGAHRELVASLGIQTGMAGFCALSSVLRQDFRMQDIMLWIEPQAGVAPIVHFIERAHKQLDINAYLLTDRRVLRAMRAAVQRGVRVRVIIDRHPYGDRPAAELGRIRQTGAQLRFPPGRFARPYVFDHAKYMVSGHALEIGSANFTWSTFHRDRDYIWTTRTPGLVSAARAVFDADWHDRRAGAAVRDRLVVSPGATTDLVQAISQPGRVCIESEEMGHDRGIVKALSKKGRLARVVLPAHLDRFDRRVAKWLVRAGVRVRYLHTPLMHAKLVAGDGIVYMGSQNFTWSSLNRNRELGVFLPGQVGAQARARCERDWAHATP
ncbi:MAG: phospholipase D-like domain-containing protein [Gammaproteobacteria bacterium]|nr:phospholipase D-like domain-containing protein [Gammaproteobacteria bacterium]